MKKSHLSILMIVCMLIAGTLLPMPAQAQSPVQSPVQSPTPQVTLEDVLIMVQDVVLLTTEAMDIYWSAQFQELGLREPMVYITTLWPLQYRQSDCGILVFGTSNNAFYCPIEDWSYTWTLPSGKMFQTLEHGEIIVPLMPMATLATFGNLWEVGLIEEGSYMVVAITAHEFAHHIVDELTLQWGALRLQNPNNELIADCIAGSFMGIMNDTQRLTAKQISNIIDGFAVIGDYNVDSSGHHGTPEERRHAFSIGYYGGLGSEGLCFDNFWN